MTEPTVILPVWTGINTLKQQLFIDITFIPKRTRKRMKSGPSRKSTRPSQKKSAHAPKPQPSTRKQKPALTRQERKEQGLCRCSQPAVQEQTRCPDCVAKYREWHRQNSENRRRAKGIKTPPSDQCGINRADPERDRRPRDPRNKPDNQESAQRSVQEEDPTASSPSPCGAQITRPLRPMRQTKPCRPDPLC